MDSDSTIYTMSIRDGTPIQVKFIEDTVFYIGRTKINAKIGNRFMISKELAEQLKKDEKIIIIK